MICYPTTDLVFKVTASMLQVLEKLSLTREMQGIVC